MNRHLAPLVGQRQFWVDYFARFTEELSFAEPFPGLTEAQDEDEDAQPYPQLEGCRIRFPLTPRTALVLELDGSLNEATLFFETGSLLRRKRVEIAWDDVVQWHPYVLRWAELEPLCRTLSIRPEWAGRPHLPMLLLYRFAPVADADDAARARCAVPGAWRALGLFSDAEVRELTKATLPADLDLRWQRGPDGHWTLVGDDAYSLRAPGNERFPFAALESALRSSGA